MYPVGSEVLPLLASKISEDSATSPVGTKFAGVLKRAVTWIMRTKPASACPVSGLCFALSVHSFALDKVGGFLGLRSGGNK
jgi:hypothetical protein